MTPNLIRYTSWFVLMIAIVRCSAPAPKATVLPVPPPAPSPVGSAPPNNLQIDTNLFKRVDLNTPLRDLSELLVYHEERSWRYNYVPDDGHLPMRPINGRPAYHPSSLASEILFRFHHFQSSGDSANLKSALHMINQVDQKSVDLRGAKYFIHSYEFDLHNTPRYHMEPPWVSALAQGKLLSVYVRAFQITRDSSYYHKSEKIFQSFLENDESGNPYWVSYIDADSLLWLEEYPLSEPNNTLNGMIVAIFGIYEYHAMKKDLLSKRILEGAIYTIKATIGKFRRECHLSNYCLNHQVQNVKYHSIHIYQLGVLYQLTGEGVFKEMAIAMDDDFDVPLKYRQHDISMLFETIK